MSIKLDCGTATLRIVTCYTPQQGCTDEAKETFWHAIDDYLRSFGADEHVVIGGDLNGHVGHTREGYERHHGGEGFGERNEEGVSILDFAETHDLAVVKNLLQETRHPPGHVQQRASVDPDRLPTRAAHQPTTRDELQGDPIGQHRPSTLPSDYGH